MKTLIIYSSKYGSTKDCAELLKNKLDGTADILNIQEKKKVNLDNYDTIILGSSIYVGSVSKKLKEYCNQNLDELREKRVGIFINCGFEREKEQYFAQNFPQSLLTHALVKECFGGEARMERMNFFYRFIMKKVSKGSYKEMKLNIINIESFASTMNEK